MPSPRWVHWGYTKGPRWVWGEVQLALLEDIRDRLTELRDIFKCANAQDIPRQLRAINRNTRRRRKVTRGNQ